MSETTSEGRLADLNRHAFSQGQSQREYGHATGYYDRGEQAALVALSAEMKGKRLLDIGVGGGRTAPLLMAISSDYVGVDYVPALAAIARERAPGADIRTMDARTMDFPDASFDAALFSFNGLDSVDLDDRVRILTEIARVLRPGGVLIYSSLNRRGPSFRQVFIPPGFNLTGGATAKAKMLARGAYWYARSMIMGPRAWLAARRQNRQYASDETVARQVTAHHCGVVLMFTTPEANRRQLDATGLALERVIDMDGADVAAGAAAERSTQIYYYARKKNA